MNLGQNGGGGPIFSAEHILRTDFIIWDMTAVKKLSLAGTVLLLAGMAIFLADPVRYAHSVSEGISLWAACVLPATFPFLFLTALLTGLPPFAAFAEKAARPTGKLFRLSGAAGGAALLAALSGYPVGARMIFDLKTGGKLAKGEEFRAACLATTSGPMFLVGTVGGFMYESAAVGWTILLSHLAAVWLVCFFARFRAKPVDSPPVVKKTNPNLLYDSLYGAVVSVLCVGGSIALFSCLGQMLADLGFFRFPLFGDCTEGVLRGLLEMTAGCAALSELKTPLSCACACAVVTFGGMCVLCQQAAFLTRAGVKILPFLCVKLAQAVLAFLLCWGACAAFGVP